MFIEKHLEVYRILESVFKKMGIYHYLIGANAKDVHLAKAGITPLRGTFDIDFAVMVPDFNRYQAMVDALVESGLERTREPYRLIYQRSNTVIDLLPYGQIEQKYTVDFLDRLTTLSVLGFQEVGQFAEVAEVQNSGITIPVAPIEGLVILKLVAWNERPDRQRDLNDISHILSIAWELYEDEAYAQHPDLFDLEDFDMTRAAARILGRKIGKVLQLNQQLSNQILNLVKEAVDEKSGPEPLEVGLAENMKKTLSEIKLILTELHLGIQDSLPKPMDGL